MIKFTLEINGNMEEILLPEAWDEVPEDIFGHLASIYLATADEMTVFDKTVRAFTLLTWKHYKFVSQLLDEELYALLPMVDWVFNKLDLQKNLLPEVKIGNKVYLAPSDGLENLRFAEWCYADTKLVDYASAPDISTLQELAAVLYRPEGKGDAYLPDNALYRGDRREKFNDNLVTMRTKVMAKLTRPQLQGIYLWFASCRQFIINQYPGVFPQKKKKDGEDDEDKQSGGWMDIYDDLRGDPKFGGAEKLEDEFAHTVFFSLERNNEKMKDLKEKYKL